MKIKPITKKNGTTVYRANVYLGVDLITGKKVKTNVTGRTKKEVKQKAQLTIRTFKENGSTRYQETIIKNYQELAELWLENYKLTVKPQSYAVIKNKVTKYLIPAFGKMKLEKITMLTVQQFVNTLPNRLASFGTVAAINKRILQYAVSLQLIPFNPAREVIQPKITTPKDDRVKFIDSQDLKKFLDHIEKQASKKYLYYFDSILYKFLLATGCRIGEALALEWSDIDLTNQLITINKTYSKNVDLVGTPKSKTANRTISIDKKTVLMLKQYQGRQRLTFLDIGQSSPSVVFATPTRTYQHIVPRQQALDRLCHNIGIPRFTFHAFRHTHASLLLNAGIGYKELQHRLGHSQLSMTMDTYSHLSKDKEKEAIKYYEKALENL